MKKLFKTEDGVYKCAGDAYYCVQDGTHRAHHHPLQVQLIKIESKSGTATSKRSGDSYLALEDKGIKRFHNKKVAEAWCKYITKLKIKTKTS